MTKKSAAIPPGVYTKIGGTEVPVFPDYSNDSQKNGDASRGLPFVNQSKPFRQLLSHLSGEYPYACLQGGPGIGKTMIIDYTTDVITSPSGLERVTREIPEMAQTLSQVRAMASNFQHRDYLLLPNFDDPMKPVVIDYTSADSSERDNTIANGFCADVRNVLGRYAQDNRTHIRVELTGGEFDEVARQRVNRIYTKLYEEVAKKTSPEDKKRGKVPARNFAIATFELPENLAKHSRFNTSWEFVRKDGDRPIQPSRYKRDAGFAAKRSGLDLDKIQEGLAETFVREKVSPEINALLWELELTDVKTGNGYLSEDEKFAFLQRTVRDYNEGVLKGLGEQYASGAIHGQREMLSRLRTQERTFSRADRISPRTLDDITKRLREVSGKYDDSGASKELRNWMDSVVNYFDRERSLLERTVFGMLESIRKIEREEPMKFRKKSKNEVAEDRESLELELRQERLNAVRFKVQHGKHDTEIGNIMQAMYFGTIRKASSGVNAVEIRDFDSDSLFGTFEGHSENRPPHATYRTLGDFFRGGILTFPDAFGDFIQSIVGEDSNKGKREQYLSYFQTGVMPIVHQGITFNMNAPRMILGSSNKYPFVTRDGPHEDHEVGLEDRIGLIQVRRYTDNTPEVRDGTRSVIRRAMEEQNKMRGAEVELSKQALEMILHGTLFDSKAALIEYRDLTKGVGSLHEFAMRRGATMITPELIKEKLREDLPPVFFYGIDRNAHEIDGWFNQPNRAEGVVCGLTAGRAGGNFFNVSSMYVPDFDPPPRNIQRFGFVDLRAELVEETAHKGHELAVAWVKRYIDGIRRKNPEVLSKGEGWRVDTQFQRLWSQSGGPSASLAITGTILSALSGEPIYKNRFVTGTIEATTGAAGAIGGTYIKGMAPTRISDLMTGENRMPLYFLFPAANLRDLTQNLRFDLFDLEKKVSAIPVRGIADTYHLLTCSPEITQDDLDNIDELGQESLDRVLRKIVERHKPKSKTSKN